MDLKVFDSASLPYVLRGLRTIAEANQAFTDGERDLLEAVALIHHAHVDIDALPEADEATIALHVTDPHMRKRLVQLALVTALIEGEPTPVTTDAIKRLAAALEVDEDGVRVLREVANGHLLLARFDFARRMRKFALRGDAAGAVKQILSTLIGLEDKAVAARYRALADYPPGTVGRTWHDHLAQNGFPFPGERYGVPELGLFHDVGHVLSGYGTEPEEEIQQAAFQAGFVRKDGFLFLLFGILQFHLGMRLTPVAEAEKGLFDVKKVLRAAERGAACEVDLSEDFDFWSIADVQVSELRARYGVPPL